MKKSIITLTLLAGLMTANLAPVHAQETSDDQQGINIEIGKDQPNNEEAKTSSTRPRRTSHGFSIDIGKNNYLSDGKFPDENNALFTVKPFGSWFVGLNVINETKIAGPLYLQWGGGINWYNFKFQNETTRLTKDDNGVIFEEDGRDVIAVKSKLTASYLNARIVPMLDFGRDKSVNSWCESSHSEGFRIGLGAYGGYRLGNKTKFVYEENGDKQREKSGQGLFLNNWRYGARFQVGYRGANLFFNYDMNELFSEGKGPELNAFSFGITLM